MPTPHRKTSHFMIHVWKYPIIRLVTYTHPFPQTRTQFSFSLLDYFNGFITFIISIYTKYSRCISLAIVSIRSIVLEQLQFTFQVQNPKFGLVMETEVCVFAFPESSVLINLWYTHPVIYATHCIISSMLLDSVLCRVCMNGESHSYTNYHQVS